MDGQDALRVAVDLDITDEEGPFGHLVIFSRVANITWNGFLPLKAARIVLFARVELLGAFLHARLVEFGAAFDNLFDDAIG